MQSHAIAFNAYCKFWACVQISHCKEINKNIGLRRMRDLRIYFAWLRFCGIDDDDGNIHKINTNK